MLVRRVARVIEERAVGEADDRGELDAGEHDAVGRGDEEALRDHREELHRRDRSHGERGPERGREQTDDEVGEHREQNPDEASFPLIEATVLLPGHAERQAQHEHRRGHDPERDLVEFVEATDRHESDQAE